MLRRTIAIAATITSLLFPAAAITQPNKEVLITPPAASEETAAEDNKNDDNNKRLKRNFWKTQKIEQKWLCFPKVAFSKYSGGLLLNYFVLPL